MPWSHSRRSCSRKSSSRRQNHRAVSALSSSCRGPSLDAQPSCNDIRLFAGSSPFLLSSSSPVASKCSVKPRGCSDTQGSPTVSFRPHKSQLFPPTFFETPRLFPAAASPSPHGLHCMHALSPDRFDSYCPPKPERARGPSHTVTSASRQRSTIARGWHPLAEPQSPGPAHSSRPAAWRPRTHPRWSSRRAAGR